MALKVGVDIDGVVYDTTAMMRDYGEKWWSSNRTTPYHFNPYKYDGAMFETDDWTGDYIMRHACNFQDVSYLNMEAINAIVSTGCEPFIITARWDDECSTRVLFKDTALQNVPIYTNVRDKGKLCKELGIHLMIDDHPSNIRSCIMWDVEALMVSTKKTLYNHKYTEQFRNVLTDWSQLPMFMQALQSAGDCTGNGVSLC